MARQRAAGKWATWSGFVDAVIRVTVLLLAWRTFVLVTNRLLQSWNLVEKRWVGFLLSLLLVLSALLTIGRVVMGASLNRMRAERGVLAHRLAVVAQAVFLVTMLMAYVHLLLTR